MEEDKSYQAYFLSYSYSRPTTHNTRINLRPTSDWYQPIRIHVEEVVGNESQLGVPLLALFRRLTREAAEIVQSLLKGTVSLTSLWYWYVV